MFYDEEMLLEIRLNALKDVVDYFVIVESTRTFKGVPRNLTLNMTKFAQFKDQIIYMVYDNSSYDPNNVWNNEYS